MTMNRRDILTSGMLIAGGTALSVLPQKAFANHPAPIPPPGGGFNHNILNAYCTTSRTAVSAGNQGRITSAQLTALATTFATFVAEMNSVGYTGFSQSTLLEQAAAVNALDAAAMDVSEILSIVQKVAPATYAQVQFAIQQINSNSKGAALTPNSLTTAYSTFESGLQQLATLAEQRGGVLNVSTPFRRGQPHILDAYLVVLSERLLLVGGGLIILGVLCPPVGMGMFLGAELTLGGAFTIMGTMTTMAGAIAQANGD